MNQGEFDTWDNHYISEFASLIDAHYQSVIDHYQERSKSLFEEFTKRGVDEELVTSLKGKVIACTELKQLLATPQEEK